MPVPRITLTGKALRGVLPALIGKKLLDALPAQVCLGCNLAQAEPPVLQLEKYFTAGAAPPPQTNYREKAAQSLARMYCNDQLGCCVVAGKMHSLGLWSGNDSDMAGGIILATDDEVRSQYRSICGPGDNGCIITNVLDVMRSRGLVANGKAYTIDGYVRCDNRNQLLTQTAQYLFGASSIGINLPKEWTQTDVWDVTSSQIVGGHDVSALDCDNEGVFISSWGRIYKMTWRAWMSSSYIKQFYVMLSPTWYNADKLSASGINAVELKADLAKLARGTIPDVEPGPAPPPGPTPPPGPGPTPTIYFTIDIASDIPAGGMVSLYPFPAPKAIPAGRLYAADLSSETPYNAKGS